jgi:hypothetical protein
MRMQIVDPAFLKVGSKLRCRRSGPPNWLGHEMVSFACSAYVELNNKDILWLRPLWTLNSALCQTYASQHLLVDLPFALCQISLWQELHASYVGDLTQISKAVGRYREEVWLTSLDNIVERRHTFGGRHDLLVFD